MCQTFGEEWPLDAPAYAYDFIAKNLQTFVYYLLGKNKTLPRIPEFHLSMKEGMRSM